MSVRSGERSLGSWRWLSVAGSRRHVFTTVGEAFRDEIQQWVATSTDLPRLDRFRGTEQLREVAGATRRGYPEQVEELEAMADGAGVAFDDLLLVNLRGDLTALGEGCSDIAVVGEDSLLIAHNEDGAPELDGLCALLTLHIDGHPTVTSVWYPGMLPGLTCWLNGEGLACGVNHIPVRYPGPGGGRQFLARVLQESRSLELFASRAGAFPMAGGYALTVGSASEGAAHTYEVGPGGVWQGRVDGLAVHTNHFLELDDPQDVEDESLDRLQILKRTGTSTDVAGLLRLLTGSPEGVRRDAVDGDPLTTHSSMVFDLRARAVSVVLRGDPNVHEVGFDDFLSAP